MRGEDVDPPQGNPPSLCLPPGHAIFKLTYLSNHDYKHLYFESDAATVNEIVLKVSALLSPGTRCTGRLCLGPGLGPPPTPPPPQPWTSFAE